MKLTRHRLLTLSLLVLCSLTAGASVQRGSVQGRNGRMESRRAAEQERRARQQESQYRARERSMMNQKVAELERHSRQARARLVEQRQREMRTWTGSVLQTFQQKCVACHPYPDSLQATDRAWLGRVRSTLCNGMNPQSRETLASYLTTVEGLQPRNIASESVAALDQGTVSSNLRSGELLLRRQGGAVFRLVWARGEQGQGRALPAGSYTFLGYRTLGGIYHAAAAGGRRKVTVPAGGRLRLPVDSSIAVELNRQRKREQLQVGLFLKGQDGMGVGLYRGGMAVPIPVVVLEGKDIVAEGVLRSVGSGRYRATLAVPETVVDGRIRVELPHDLPFKTRGPTAVKL